MKGKEIATLLGYKDTDDAIRKLVNDKYNTKINNPVNCQGNPQAIFIQELGIFRSKLESAEMFQDWVFSEVLPLIRKYGHYRMFNNPKSLALNKKDEYDVHTKVVQFFRRFYPEILMTAGLGENQDTSQKKY